ncbi:hypothetical protein DFP73DRAFT_285873 [Morchella snyderi]|nr:hypothetical protein DFP73DRAFT_285873 [Morchella snyderi]
MCINPRLRAPSFQIQHLSSALHSIPYPTMDEKALRTELDELRRQIADLQSKHAEHSKDEHAQPAQCLTTQHSYPPPAAPQLAVDREHCVNCRCRSPARGPNTGTVAPPPQGRGVYLGLLRAGDLGGLSDRALNELDDGLKAIARRVVPRVAGAPPVGTFPRAKADMIALLNKVSLRTDPVPGVAPGVDHFAAFRDPKRGRNFRLNDARQLQFGLIPEGDRSCLMYFETFVQLVQFRGIDVEELA